MGVTAAAALVGCGPVVRVAAKAVNTAREVGQVAPTRRTQARPRHIHTAPGGRRLPPEARHRGGDRRRDEGGVWGVAAPDGGRRTSGAGGGCVDERTQPCRGVRRHLAARQWVDRGWATRSATGSRRRSGRREVVRGGPGVVEGDLPAVRRRPACPHRGPRRGGRGGAAGVTAPTAHRPGVRPLPRDLGAAPSSRDSGTPGRVRPPSGQGDRCARLRSVASGRPGCVGGGEHPRGDGIDGARHPKARGGASGAAPQARAGAGLVWRPLCEGGPSVGHLSSRAPRAAESRAFAIAASRSLEAC